MSVDGSVKLAIPIGSSGRPAFNINFLPINPTNTWVLDYYTCCGAVNEAGFASTLRQTAVAPWMKNKIQHFFFYESNIYGVPIKKRLKLLGKSGILAGLSCQQMQRDYFFPLPCRRRQRGWGLTCLLEIDAPAQRRTNWGKWLQKGLNEIQIRLKRERCFRSTRMERLGLTRGMHLENRKTKTGRGLSSS